MVKKKLTGFIVLLFVIQCVFIGGTYFSSQSEQQRADAGREEPARTSAETKPYISAALPESSASEHTLLANQDTEILSSELDLEAEDSTTPALIPSSSAERLGNDVIYRVKRGDTLSRIWEKMGGEVRNAHLAAQAFREEGLSLASLRAGEDITLRLNETGNIAFVRKDLPEGRVLSLYLKDGRYDAEILDPEIITTRREVSGTIDHSLAAASLQQGVPYEVIDEFIDLFSGRVEFSRDTQRGDSFSVIFDERNAADGRALSPGDIHAASFMNRGEMMVAIRHTAKNGEVHYYDREGKPIGNHFLRYPVKFTRISSVFTKGRFHPVLKRWRPHNGVDFAAPTGTPVRSVADGVVVKSGYYGGNGNMVKIKHGDKYASAYVHLSRISKGVRQGARVSRGQVIGGVGSTGLATGPHLHYAFYVNGKYVDPMKIKLPRLPNKFEPIPAKLLKATLQRLEKQHQTVQLARQKEMASQHENA
ncbi:peptidoglycan DD-metalloendopeptidase family protein [bacterium]|nr:peptidoglycan DD-metalloendopeptidase family protein [bacterium]